jgi:hypothetical protein
MPFWNRGSVKLYRVEVQILRSRFMNVAAKFEITNACEEMNISKTKIGKL